MKSSIIKICLVFICTILAIDANAQRPVWVVGHACNSRQCLLNTLSDGGCGVEIDVSTDYKHKSNFWTVAHDGYISREDMDNYNRRRSEYDYYVSLEEYLNFREMNDISILWLDVKNGEYLVDLVNHVHAVLLLRYPDGKIPFSIIYGVYKIDVLQTQVSGPSYIAIDWLRDNLWEKEGINLAWEGKDKNQHNGMGSGYIMEINQLMTSHNFPVYKHFMTCGYWSSPSVHRNSIETTSILEAKSLRSQGKYCSRIGFWTCGWYSDAIWFIEPRWADIQTECDLVLVECRNEFKAPGDKWALWKLVQYYFKPNGDYYSKYNGGRTRIANQTDVFYKMP